VTWTIYVGLGAGVLAVVGGAVFLTVRILEAWRTLKRLRRHVGRELDRLRSGLAQLAVLRRALDEATGTFGRLTAVYPRK
jgi:hypothetical protein